MITAILAQSISDKAKKLHFSSIVIDTHDDTTQRLLDSHFDIAVPHTDGNIDIPRMRDGGLTAIFFSIWIDGKILGPEAVKRALDQIDAVRETVRKHPDELILATTADEIREAKKQKKIAALMGVEGGHMMGNDLAVLRTFAALGVRYMTLTHMQNNEWADSSTAKPEHNGLTDFGKQVVREMNRLGMIVDISHVSDKTFYDVLETTKAPVFASHSSCRALCNAARNMTDDMIRDLAKHDGVMQINYHVGFLSQEFRDFEAAHPDVEKEIGDEVKKRCGTDETCTGVAGDQVVRDMMKAGKLPKVDWTLNRRPHRPRRKGRRRRSRWPRLRLRRRRHAPRHGRRHAPARNHRRPAEERLLGIRHSQNSRREHSPCPVRSPKSLPRPQLPLNQLFAP